MVIFHSFLYVYQRVPLRHAADHAEVAVPLICVSVNSRSRARSNLELRFLAVPRAYYDVAEEGT